ncbi:winged helix-turn-helix domain-containing protein [Serratia plymuthica]|jgi:DNA-binding winged helix-turn-helix (wHTH) protein|nr:winged helix-turn-helix domain-containing protein [Serratia plymuthica]
METLKGRMHNYYIINGVVEFHPAVGTLRDLKEPGHVIVLNSPASRCFLLLIENVKTIVPQQEFMDVVWKMRGMQVSPNTYYQNISILRKGLSNIGLADDVIVTIPRIGLTLASNIQIKKLTSENRVHVNPEGLNFIKDSNKDLLNSIESKETNRELIASQSVSDLHEPEEIKRKNPGREIIYWGIGVLAIIAFFCCIALCIIVYEENKHFDDYHFSGVGKDIHMRVVKENNENYVFFIDVIPDYTCRLDNKS